MKIGISTMFDCVIDCKGQKYTFFKNTSFLELEMQNQEEVFLLFYPINDDKLISYASVLKIENNTLNFDKAHLKYNIDNLGNYELIYLPFKLSLNALKKVYKNIKNDFNLFVVLADKNFVCFDDGEEMFFEEFIGELNHYEFLTISNNPSIMLKTDVGQHLFVLNIQKSKIEIFFGQIELKENGIICVTDEKNDFAKHALITEYKFENGELVTISNELLYARSEPQISTNAKIVPLAFFEAVKIKNFSLAKEYLTQNLARQVSKEILEGYFGELDKIKPYNFQVDKGYYISVISGEKSKIFRIKIQDAKIDEIELLTQDKKLT